MAERDVLLKALDSAHWELSEALRDLPDHEVWTRPDPRLLSVGELVAHVAYGEASSFLGEGFESPLVAASPRYYTSSVGAPLHLEFTVTTLWEELQRVHHACKSGFSVLAPDLGTGNPHREGWTWGATLEYQAFHVAYHTGQIYSVRHLRGHETVDN